VKVSTYIQYQGKEVLSADLEKRVREIWRQKGYLAKELNTIALYIKVEENACYYVINDTVKGMVPLGE
jgi:hypothetical protein